MYLAISHVLKSQNQIFPRWGPPYPTATPPHTPCRAGGCIVLSAALRRAQIVWRLEDFFCFRNVQNSRNFGNSKHSVRLSDTVSEKNRTRFCG